ncbi:putative membrane protein [Sedimentibacter acidaminivorans]|uniref:Membrane protein n=1 Tax=Sedimentibacter acidaminivorans TaxID=913099 RepID=A0ABS4GD19_9FIRM|nr:hypothetical protein [Sedimentibacter acidaminivorans]MBP1925586.1 putative membrane protein [Sedimentibacter acidaminivorans]
MKTYAITEFIILIIVFLVSYNIIVFADEGYVKITESEIMNEDGTISKFRYEEDERELIIYNENIKYKTKKTVHDKNNNTVKVYELQENEMGDEVYVEIISIDKNMVEEIEQMERDIFSYRKFKVLNRKLNQDFDKSKFHKSIQID